MNSEVLVSRRHKVLMVEDKLLIDGVVIEGLMFRNLEVTFELPSGSTVRFRMNEIQVRHLPKDGSFLETEIDEWTLESIMKEVARTRTQSNLGSPA